MAEPIAIVAVLALIVVTAVAMYMIHKNKKDTDKATGLALQAATNAAVAAEKSRQLQEVQAYDIYPPHPYYYNQVPVYPLYGYYYGGGSHGGRRGSYHGGGHHGGGHHH